MNVLIQLIANDPVYGIFTGFILVLSLVLVLFVFWLRRNYVGKLLGKPVAPESPAKRVTVSSLPVSKRSQTFHADPITDRYVFHGERVSPKKVHKVCRSGQTKSFKILKQFDGWMFLQRSGHNRALVIERFVRT
jgi:hypothetical protein